MKNEKFAIQGKMGGDQISRATQDCNRSAFVWEIQQDCNGTRRRASRRTTYYLSAANAALPAPWRSTDSGQHS